MEGSGDFEDVTCGDDGVSSGLVDFSVAVTESDNSGERKRVISDGENTTSLLPPSLNNQSHHQGIPDQQAVVSEKKQSDFEELWSMDSEVAKMKGFTLIEDEKFDFVIPDEFLDISLEYRAENMEQGSPLDNSSNSLDEWIFPKPSQFTTTKSPPTTTPIKNITSKDMAEETAEFKTVTRCVGKSKIMEKGLKELNSTTSLPDSLMKGTTSLPYPSIRGTSSSNSMMTWTSSSPDPFARGISPSSHDSRMREISSSSPDPLMRGVSSSSPDPLMRGVSSISSNSSICGARRERITVRGGGEVDANKHADEVGINKEDRFNLSVSSQASSISSARSLLENDEVMDIVAREPAPKITKCALPKPIANRSKLPKPATKIAPATKHIAAKPLVKKPAIKSNLLPRSLAGRPHPPKENNVMSSTTHSAESSSSSSRANHKISKPKALKLNNCKGIIPKVAAGRKEMEKKEVHSESRSVQPTPNKRSSEEVLGRTITKEKKKTDSQSLSSGLVTPNRVTCAAAAKTHIKRDSNNEDAVAEETANDPSPSTDHSTKPADTAMVTPKSRMGRRSLIPTPCGQKKENRNGENQMSPIEFETVTINRRKSFVNVMATVTTQEDTVGMSPQLENTSSQITLGDKPSLSSSSSSSSLTQVGVKSKSTVSRLQPKGKGLTRSKIRGSGLQRPSSNIPGRGVAIGGGRVKGAVKVTRGPFRPVNGLPRLVKDDGPKVVYSSYPAYDKENVDVPLVPRTKVVHSPLDKENQPATPHSKWSPIRKKPVNLDESCFRCTKRLN